MSPLPSTLIRSRRTHLAVGLGLSAVAVAVVAAFATSSPVASAPTQSPSPSPTAEASTKPSPTPSATTSPSPTPAHAARCPLDGMPLAEGAELPGTALAVQIENHPEARPARNLTRADMVVETTVEGDMTRFTAIYLCDETLGMTGPVRSARYYNIDLWQDLHVLTVAFGRSDGAYERFVAAGMPFANGMDGGWSWFRRHGPNAAPHNLYLDLEALRAGITTDAALGRLAAAVDPLRPPFAFDESPSLPDDSRAVDAFEMQTNSYWRFGWSWDAESASWLRRDGSSPVSDEATGERVTATTVIVQRVTQETVYGDPDPDGSPRRLQHLVGDGEGTAYIDGRAYPIHWDRPSADAATTWTFADGEPVVLPPGPVWWEILPVESDLTES